VCEYEKWTQKEIMLRAVNHNQRKIICCPATCGTTFLHLHVLKSDEYEHIRGSWNIPKDYTIYRVIRDPMQRFYSWYSIYIVDKNQYPDTAHRFLTEPINENNIEEWFKTFNTVMHYDEHTALQKYIHQFDNRFNQGNIKYISSTHLQKFLNTSADNYQEKIYNNFLRNNIDKYLQEMYKEDVEWIKTLEVIK
jgi:hypothetical protein